MTRRPLALTRRDKSKSISRKGEPGNMPNINKDYSMYESGRHSNEFNKVKPPLPKTAAGLAGQSKATIKHGPPTSSQASRKDHLNSTINTTVQSLQPR